jgi:[acyl-carrier-protein] S-malonyltransferase
MFEGTTEELKETKLLNQPCFTRYIAKTLGDDFKPEMVAGHSLGEFSALV